jgi:hypothetical protein
VAQWRNFQHGTVASNGKEIGTVEEEDGGQERRQQDQEARDEDGEGQGPKRQEGCAKGEAISPGQEGGRQEEGCPEAGAQARAKGRCETRTQARAAQAARGKEGSGTGRSGDACRHASDVVGDVGHAERLVRRPAVSVEFRVAVVS